MVGDVVVEAIVVEVYVVLVVVLLQQLGGELCVHGRFRQLECTLPLCGEVDSRCSRHGSDCCVVDGVFCYGWDPTRCRLQHDSV